jgi:hypothetical protein
MYPSKFQEQGLTIGGQQGDKCSMRLQCDFNLIYSQSNPGIGAMCDNILKLMDDSLQETLQVYLLKTMSEQDLNISITLERLRL